MAMHWKIILEKKIPTVYLSTKIKNCFFNNNNGLTIFYWIRKCAKKKKKIRGRFVYFFFCPHRSSFQQICISIFFLSFL